MKKLTLITLVLIASTSCTRLDFWASSVSFSTHRNNQIYPVDKIQTLKIKLGEFNRINYFVFGNIKIERGDENKMVFEADEAITSRIETKIVDGELLIYCRKNFLIAERKANVVITVKSPIYEIINQGQGKMTIDFPIEKSGFSLRQSGSGVITAQIKNEELDAHISGSGKLNLSGETEKLNLKISGSGKALTTNLKTNNSHIEISGSGNAQVQADKTLYAKISGSGQISYSGEASVDKKISGSGRVSRI